MKRSAGVTGVLAAANGCAPADQRPNIIFAMGDDHGWEETGYNGHRYLQTPVLDDMAATGLRMDRFYSAAPVCSPTRSSVLTGRHPNRCGTFGANWSIRPEEITIAHILGDSGYACGHFGKWHVGPVKAGSPTNPGAMGFEEWLSHDNFFEMNPQFSRNGGPPEPFEGESSEILAEESIRFMERAIESRRPFLAVVWFGSPHEPYGGLEADLALYDSLPREYKDQTVRLTSMENGLPVDRPLFDVLRERFAEITAMDRAIGRLRQYLRDEGIDQNTILWYCGDNGVPVEANVATPFRGQKGLVYEGGIRVPSVIEWPGRFAAPRATAINSVTSDILPTLCDLLGENLPDRPLDGVSLKSLIDGAMTERTEPICFWSYNSTREVASDLEPYIDPELQSGTTPLVKAMAGSFTRSFQNYHHPDISDEDFQGARAILDNRYKLVLDADGPPELFDVREDPVEKRNVLGEHPQIAQDLEARLSDWQRSVLNSLTGADYL